MLLFYHWSSHIILHLDIKAGFDAQLKLNYFSVWSKETTIFKFFFNLKQNASNKEDPTYSYFKSSYYENKSSISSYVYNPGTSPELIKLFIISRKSYLTS